MNRRTRIGASIAASATAVVAVAAIAVANPSASSGDDATPNPTATSAPQQNTQRTPETPLTGAAAEDAIAAALEAVPGGTVLRVETDSDGGGVYEAHVRRADGTEVVVLLDKEFAVLSVEEFTGRGGHGPRGGKGGPGETPLTGDKAEKATAAATAAVSGGTVIRVETDANDGATYEAHVRRADGTEVIVLMDGDFTVTAVEEFTGRGGHGPRGGGGHGPRGGPDDGDGSGAQDGTTATPTPTA
jgi:uncharacterized membrane protein YkoI